MAGSIGILGWYTMEAQATQSAMSRRLQQLEDAMHLLGMTTAKRSRGRKANGYAKLTSLDDVKSLLDNLSIQSRSPDN